jgi:hypothetical protein
MVNIPTLGDVIAAFFSASPQAGDPGVCVNSRNRIEAEPGPDEPVPFTLTDQAEAVLDADPEPELDAEAEAEAEAEWADNWDSADSGAYMDRVEAGLEPEVES